VVEVLAEVVDEVVDIDVNAMSDAELHSAVVSLETQISRLRGAQAKLVAEWDARRVWCDDGSKNSAARLSRETGMSQSSARCVVKRARRLKTMALSSEALAGGDLHCDRVDLLVRINRSELAELFSRDEELLISQMKDLGFSDCVRLCTYWSQLADESGSEDRANRQFEKRGIYASRTLDGVVDISGVLDPIGGEIFLDELSRLERQLFENDWAEAKEIHGENTRAEHLGRSSAQLRADALVEMAKRSRSAPANSIRPKPLISVVVDYKTFSKRICELASGTVITPGQVVPMLDEAEIERIVFDGRSRVIDVGRKRTFTGALRRAIQVRDRFCMHEGCEEPASRSQIDHIEPYSAGGPTRQSNAQSLCATHNRAKGPRWGKSRKPRRPPKPPEPP